MTRRFLSWLVLAVLGVAVYPFEAQALPPRAMLESTAPNPTGVSPIPVAVTFSEDVLGFEDGDIAVTNATVTNFSGSGSRFSFDLVPLASGTVSAAIPAGVCTDQASNANLAEGAYFYCAKWGSQGSDDGLFDQAYGVAVDAAGDIYVSDLFNHRIQKFDSEGNFLDTWGGPGTGDGEFNGPYAIAFGPSGNIYITDLYNHRIQKFDASGNFITKWGSEGGGDGQFYLPYGIAVDSSEIVYVADSKNHRIQKFDATGTFLSKWGSLGSGDGEFNYAYGVAVDASSNVYVADLLNSRVQKFDVSGNFLTKWGTFGIFHGGELAQPQGITVDSAGDVYVADTSNDRFQKFDSTGAFLAMGGRMGEDDGCLSYPNGIAVDASGHVYVADVFNYRIQKFCYGEPFLSREFVNEAPNAPIVTGPALTNDPMPTWTWVSGGGGGVGAYRCQLDGDMAAWEETAATCFTPATGLSHGVHTLYVQEQNALGNWSESGSFAITLDTERPRVASVTPLNSTTVRVVFNEAMTSDDALTNPASYTFLSSQKPLAAAGVTRISETIVEVTVNPMACYVVYTLVVSTDGPLDLAGNGIDPAHNTRQFILADLDGSGTVNAIDVQLVILAALNILTGYDCDVNDDGIVNALDVQLIINAALGI